ncbi:hypothetical protein BU004_10575 [Mammaliicoccus sciuri]|uniref:Pycsar system effector family protein n=1 Tax=Mammaliicoccus sciuri TaxID=1296 RepID=UPI000E6A19EB|nr:Pycsar system effector family protein [Mammaliicoccus sciuri]RIN84216.1 hypothetical protein BU004_10575 [Mammaliicoccus sciuri]
MTENKRLKKEDLQNELDRHLDWIKSCDTKASIVLAIFGVFIVSFSSLQFLNIHNNIFSSVVYNINFSNMIYLLLMIISYATFLYGTYKIIRVLVPQLKKSTSSYKGVVKDSLYYFENISDNTYAEYKLKKSNRTIEEDNEDLLSQIYINAQIATKKYNLYRQGISLAFIGIIGILILYILGLILVKLGGF